MTDILDKNDNQNDDSSKNEDIKKVEISQSDLDALNEIKNKFEKKEGDFEKAHTSEKTKRKELQSKLDELEGKDSPEPVDKDSLKKELLTEINENSVFSTNNIADDKDKELIRQSAQILGVSIEEAIAHDTVKDKLQTNAQDRANKASEDDIALNGVFGEGSMLNSDDFKNAYEKGTLPKTQENKDRYIKDSGLVL